MRPTQKNLTVSLVGQRQSLLAGKTPIAELKKHPDRPRSPVQTSNRCTDPSGAGQQRRRAGRACDRRRDIGDDRIHLFGEGPRRFGGGLRAAQLSRRDHLHGLGDLLRRLGGGDADPHVFQ